MPDLRPPLGGPRGAGKMPMAGADEGNLIMVRATDGDPLAAKDPGCATCHGTGHTKGGARCGPCAVPLPPRLIRWLDSDSYAWREARLVRL
jgi:hypothetical protein